MPTKVDRAARRTDALTKERIIAAAIGILDAEGESALTFRALATELSTGAGAIYWHVANKDELLATAASTIIAQATTTAHPDGDDREEIRIIALALFDAFDAHPWIGSQLARESWRLGNTQIFEAAGSKLQALGVPAASQFDAASTLTNYISGAASQNAAHARTVPPGIDRATFLTLVAERWAHFDPADYPFVHQVMAQLPDHDDRQQFLAGIDFILAGITSIEQTQS